MNAKTLTGTVVGLAVVVILAATLLMPALNDATKTTETVQNIGQYYMTDDDTSYVIVYDPTNQKLTVNDEDVALSNFSGDCTLVSTPTFMLRLNAYASQNYNLWIITDNNRGVIANTTFENNVTVSFEDGTYTAPDGTTTISYDSDEFRGYTPSEDNYVMTNGTDLPILDKTSSIILGNGTTSVTNWWDRFYIEGTIEGVTVTTKDTITVSDVTVNASAVDKYVDGYEFTSVTFTATDGENTATATYNRVIVPAEVTLELSQHLDSGEIALVNVIPIIIIASIVVAAVGMVVTGRRD